MSNLEKNRLNAILVEAAKLAGRVVLFRNNVAKAWVGMVYRRTATTLILSNYRPLEAGLTPGSSDLIGWSEVVITPEMVGKKVAVFTAIEDKSTKDKAREKQSNFLQRLKDAGGCCGIARTAEEAMDIVKGYQPSEV